MLVAVPWQFRSGYVALLFGEVDEHLVEGRLSDAVVLEKTRQQFSLIIVFQCGTIRFGLESARVAGAAILQMAENVPELDARINLVLHLIQMMLLQQGLSSENPLHIGDHRTHLGGDLEKFAKLN